MIMDAEIQPFKKGMIILWWGDFASIPKGWKVCSGNNETPNLMDRVVMGAGSTYATGDTGGAVTHNHTVDDEPHEHNLTIGNAIAAGSDYGLDTTSVDTGISINNADVRPPYYALFYIMKV